MNTDVQDRLEKIEILFSEQDYTIQTLNQIVTRHADKIDLLEQRIDLYKQQIMALQEAQHVESNADTLVDERPPHY